MSIKTLTEGFDYKSFNLLREATIRQITSILSSLNEAEMSDEDRRDTKILRDILAKASAAEYDKRRSLNYTPREIEVANKYNLDLPAKIKKWDGTEISKLRDKDVDVPRGQGRDRYSPSLVRDMDQERGLRYNRNANLANYIRTRKEKGPKSERPYAQTDKFARNDNTDVFGDTTFTHDTTGRFGRDRWDEEHGRAPSLAGGKMRAADLTDVEKDRVRVNKEMSRPVKDMKAALKDREQHQQALDDIDLDYARDVSRARERFDSDMRDAEERKRRNSAEGTQGVADANSRINKLLKKESLEDANLDKLYRIADRYSVSRPVSGDWDTETVHEQRAIAKGLGISMKEAKQVMIDQLGFTEDMFVESFSVRLKNKIDSLNEAEMSDEDRHDSDILKQIYQKTQGRANAALTQEEKDILKKYNLERVPYMKNIRSSEGGYKTPIFDDREFMGSYDWSTGKKTSPKSTKINYADRARKRPERDAQTYDMRDRDFWDMPTPDYESQHEVDSDDYRPATYQQRQRQSDNQKMTQDVRDMKRALRDRKNSQKSLDSADYVYQVELDKLKKDYEDKLARAQRSQQYRTDSDRRNLDSANKRINKLLGKEEN